MKIKIVRIVSIAFTVCLMCLIFVFSSENSNQSSHRSGNVIYRISSIKDKQFAGYSTEKQDEVVAEYQHFVRKAAHFSVYFLLGVSSFLAAITYKSVKFKYRMAFSALVCLLYASSDEIHQLFVPGRSGQISDVMLDFSGACLGILTVALIVKSSKRLYQAVRWSINEERL